MPGVLAFLPEYASLEDPVADVRAASVAAAAWVAEAGPVTVVADEQGRRVARLCWPVPRRRGRRTAYLVVANGSARRDDTAPGYLDARAVPFDDAVEAALRVPDPDALARLDIRLAESLLVGNPAGLVRLETSWRGAHRRPRPRRSAVRRRLLGRALGAGVGPQVEVRHGDVALALLVKPRHERSQPGRHGRAGLEGDDAPPRLS